MICSVEETVGTTGLGEKLNSSLLAVLYLRCPPKAVGCMRVELRGKDLGSPQHVGVF